MTVIIIIIAFIFNLGGYRIRNGLYRRHLGLETLQGLRGTGREL